MKGKCISIVRYVMEEQKKTKKKMAYKHIDSYYLKERYQADTVYLSNYLVADKKYILTIVDHFPKYCWIVVMSDKKAATVLRAIKLCLVLMKNLKFSTLIMVLSLQMKSLRHILKNRDYTIFEVRHIIFKAKEL